ncbi:MAG: hypothetical protein QNL91_01375 [Candidatus Krumholzibacteria bacterium]|nr:hypothetical protein [Candidatus Krumholzibacteria bacterium]
MKLRTLVSLSVVVMMLSLVGACGGDSDQGLDVAGMKLGKDLTSTFGEVTKLLGGVTDLDSAKAALPKLTNLDSSLGDIVAKAAKLSPESLDSFKGMAAKAMPTVEGAMAKLSDIPGASQTLKPVMDSMMAKIKSLM